MRNRYRILFTVMVILTISGLLGYKATQLLEEIFHYRSPLMENPPHAGNAIQPPLTDKVVIILLDGLRVDTASNSELMPELARLRNQGASSTMISHPPSYSEPGYTTILTGAWPDINDGPAFNLEYGEIPAITQETIFKTANAAGLKTAISAYYWFEELIPQEHVDLSFYTPGEDREADRAVVDAALPWVTDNSINLLLVHIDQIDYAGHYEGGSVSAGWDEAAARSDQLLAELMADIDLSTTTLLVFSDHGHIDAGGHGGHDEVTLQEPFVAVGLGINPGEYGNIQMVDLAPTIAILLGTSLPSSTEGNPLVDMLTLSGNQLEDIDRIHNSQQTKLIEAYAMALGTNEASQVKDLTDSQSAIAILQSEYLSKGQYFRSLLAGLFLSATLYWGYRKRHFALPALEGAVIFLLSFHMFYSIIPDQPYSFSIITSPEMFIINAVACSSIAFFLSAILVVSITRLWRESQSIVIRRCLNFTFLMLLVATAPALWYFIKYGPTVQKVLPDIGLLFRAMLSLLEGMTVGVIGLVLTGIFWVIVNFFIRHKQ